MRKFTLTILFLTALCLSILAPAHAQKAELVVQEGHRKMIGSVAWSPNGKTLASASTDGTVKLWDKSGLLLRTLGQDETLASGVAWSPDGTRVISAHGKSIKIWKADSGELLKTLDGFVFVFALSPDGKTIAAASSNAKDEDENKVFNIIKIFDVGSGKVQRSLKHEGDVRALAWSRDGKRLISGSSEKTVKIWNMPSGTLSKTLSNEAMGEIYSIALSPDGAQLAVATDETDKFFLWSTQSGLLLRTISTKNEEGEGYEKIEVWSVAWSPDGKSLASGHEDEAVRVWDANSWNCRVLRPSVEEEVVDEKREALRAEMAKENMSFSDEESADPSEIYSLAWNPDGKTLAAGGGFDVSNTLGKREGSSLRTWDGVTGELIHAFTGVEKGYYGYRGKWSIDLKKLAREADDSKSIEIFDMTSGRLLNTVNCQVGIIRDFAWSPDGETLAICGSGKNINLFKANSGQLLRTLIGHTAMVHCLSWNPDGTQLASGSQDETIKIWNVQSGVTVHTIASQDTRKGGQAVGVIGLAWNPNGRTIASHHSFADNHVAIWDVMSGALLDSALSDSLGLIETIVNISWHPGGEALLIETTEPTFSGTNGHFMIYDVKTREREDLNESMVSSAAWSPDGKTLAVGGKKQLTTFTFAPEKTVSRRIEFAGYEGEVGIIAWSPDGKTLAASDNSTLKFWDVATHKVKLTVPSFADGDSLVIDPQGRFDGTPGGLEQLHYVVGLEPVALDQLKERYYTPGLWAKTVGADAATLSAVPKFNEVALYPDVELVPPAPGDTKLRVRLKNQGGGLGRVEIKVGGKELLADARGKGFDDKAATQTLEIDLSGAGAAGQKVPIEVVAWNAEGYVRSRGVRLEYQAPGERTVVKPRFYAIVVGTSRFPDNARLNLQFAAKDAGDMAQALRLGAQGLFGSAQIHLLSSDAAAPADKPTRENIARAFADVARDAREGDVLVVYFSGHGVGLRVEGRDYYCYLTQDARDVSEAAFADPQVRATVAITSEDLANWTNPKTGIKAQKQVLILDTCAAGAVAARLDQQKDTDADVVRAVDRLNERSGFYVLMGCAASAQSFEANRFGQGILTYSLLQGVKGGALRDGRFVDVSRLFAFAQDGAETLAKSVGLLQQPRTMAGSGQSFDIGDLDATRREQIPLARAKPVLLRPTLQNETEGFDTLELATPVQNGLREACLSAARGDGTPIFLAVEPGEFAEGIKPTILYRVEGAVVKARLIFSRKGKKLGELAAQGSATPEKRAQLVEKIVAALVAFKAE